MVKITPETSEEELNTLGFIKEDLRDADLSEVAALYARVFAGDPWNEVTKCPSCDKFFGHETKVGQKCTQCGTNELTEAYPLDETATYIEKEIGKPHGVGCSVQAGENLAGFAWGFSYPSAEDFVNSKYHTNQMREKLTALLKNKKGINGEFFYLSEVGIDPRFRGKGLSNYLSRQLLNSADVQNVDTVMRTNCQSPMVAIARRFSMEQIMGPRVTADTNRQSITEQGGFVNFIDEENSDRVLYLRRR